MALGRKGPIRLTLSEMLQSTMVERQLQWLERKAAGYIVSVVKAAGHIVSIYDQGSRLHCICCPLAAQVMVQATVRVSLSVQCT